jgi:hypothetical protein
MAAPGGLAQRGQGVRGLARLREHKHRAGRLGMSPRGSRTAGVLAGILHIHGQPGQVFEQDLCSQTGVPAGAAGRDDQVAMPREQRRHAAQRLFAEADRSSRYLQVVLERPLNRLRLLVDLAQHVVRKDAGLSIRHGSPGQCRRPASIVQTRFACHWIQRPGQPEAHLPTMPALPKALGQT